MSFSGELSMGVALVAGFFSFFSPCVFPLIPSYLSYLTGFTLDELQSRSLRVQLFTLLHTICFVAGFSVIFISLGASATYFGQILFQYRDWIMRVGGVVVIVLGLYLMGMVPVGFLSQERRFEFHRRPAGFLGSWLVGCSFAIGWTPCVGPVLGAILIYASTASDLSKGIKLLSFYSLGFAFPFILISLAFNFFLSRMKVVSRHGLAVRTISGLLLVGMGIVILTGSFPLVSQLLDSLF